MGRMHAALRRSEKKNRSRLAVAQMRDAQNEDASAIAGDLLSQTQAELASSARADRSAPAGTSSAPSVIETDVGGAAHEEVQPEKVSVLARETSSNRTNYFTPAQTQIISLSNGEEPVVGSNFPTAAEAEVSGSSNVESSSTIIESLAPAQPEISEVPDERTLTVHNTVASVEAEVGGSRTKESYSASDSPARTLTESISAYGEGEIKRGTESFYLADNSAADGRASLTDRLSAIGVLPTFDDSSAIGAESSAATQPDMCHSPNEELSKSESDSLPPTETEMTSILNEHLACAAALVIETHTQPQEINGSGEEPSPAEIEPVAPTLPDAESGQIDEYEPAINFLARAETEVPATQNEEPPSSAIESLPSVPPGIISGLTEDASDSVVDSLTSPKPEISTSANEEVSDVALPALSEIISGANENASGFAGDSPGTAEPGATIITGEDLSSTERVSIAQTPPEITNAPNGGQPPPLSNFSPRPEPEVINAAKTIPASRTSATFWPVGPEPQVTEFLRTLETATTLPSKLAKPTRFEPSPDAKSPNGFRHLTLRLQEESRLVFPTEPDGLAAEQFRLLRRTLSREFDTGGVLLITSPAMGDGKTLTSVNLSICLAETGHPTLLVEADVRRPTIRTILSHGIEPPGLEDVLAGKVQPARAVHGIKELNLYAAIVAKLPKNPSQLMSGPGVRHFLTWAREHFLWVVLDAPPVLPTADVPELLPLADAALLVVRAQSTPRELAKRAVEMLGKHLRGVIFNEVTVESNPHYRYLSHYYHSSRSDAASEEAQTSERSVDA